MKKQLTRGLAAALVLGALSASAEPAATLTLDLGGGARLELILVKLGVFRQGSPMSEAGRAEDETAREVTLTRDFYLGKYEVTVRQFARFVQETGYKTEAEKGGSGGFGWDGKALTQDRRFTWRDPGFPISDEHPVTIVTSDDALAFTAWLSRRAGRTVSLPTESQWEYAARGGSQARFYAGDAEHVARDIGWYKGNAGNGAHPVGQKKANAFGLHDMAGNVYEWCRDWYAPYRPGPVSDPEEMRSTLSDRPRRVLRGGSWLKNARDLRSAARYRNAPGSRNADNGFRVVASAQAAPTPAAAPPAAVAQPAGNVGDGASWTLLRWIPTALFGGVFLLVAVVVIRALMGSLAGSAGPRIKTGPDGFTIFAPQAKVGERIRYRYVVDGRSETGEMTVQGDPAQGMFVFTGSSPSRVDIMSVRSGPSAAPTQPTATAVDDEPSSFRGYPSAY